MEQVRTVDIWMDMARCISSLKNHRQVCVWRRQQRWSGAFGESVRSSWDHLGCSFWRRLRGYLTSVCSFLVRTRGGTDMIFPLWWPVTRCVSSEIFSFDSRKRFLTQRWLGPGTGCPHLVTSGDHCLPGFLKCLDSALGPMVALLGSSSAGSGVELLRSFWVPSNSGYSMIPWVSS